MTAVRGKICVVRGDQGLIQKACGYQACCTQYNRVYQVNDIRRELAETAYEQGAKEVKLEFWIKGKRYSGSANKFSPCILLHTTIWTQQQRLVVIRL